MEKAKKLLLITSLILLSGCNLNFNRSGSYSGASSNNVSSTSSINISNENNTSKVESSTTSNVVTSSTNITTSSSSSFVAPTIKSTIVLHNLDQIYSFEIEGEFFNYNDIPEFSFEDRTITGWYFDELFYEEIEEGVYYAIESVLDIFAKVEYNYKYFIKDFLIDSVARININTENEKVVNTKEEYTNATFEIIDNKIRENNFAETSIRIKCRGNSSFVNAHLQGQPFENSKFSYKIKFDTKQDLFGFGKDKEWNLIANFMDRSFIRNHLVYSLSKLMNNLEFTIEHKYVELYLNGKYNGLYLLTESVKTGSNRVDIEEPFTAEDSEIPFMLEQDQKALEDGSIEGVDYFWSHRGLPFSTKYPDTFSSETITSAQYKYIRNKLNELYDNVSNENYEKYLDVNSFIDYFMVQEIFRNVDVNHSSVYLYKRVGEPFKMGPIWDFDLSMGNYDYIDNQPDKFLKSLVGGGGNYLYNTLMAKSKFKNAYLERFKFVKDIYLKAMQEALPEIKESLRNYADRDYDKWETLGNNVDCLANNPVLVGIKSFDGHVDYIENYMFKGLNGYKGRINWLNEYLQFY